MVIHDLSTDFADGVVLINLLEILSGKTVGRYSLKPSSRFLKIENVVIALKFIDQKLQLKLYGTSAEGNCRSHHLPVPLYRWLACRYCGWEHENHLGYGVAADPDLPDWSGWWR